MRNENKAIKRQNQGLLSNNSILEQKVKKLELEISVLKKTQSFTDRD